jgi:hypothetical protein
MLQSLVATLSCRMAFYRIIAALESVQKCNAAREAIRASKARAKHEYISVE